MQNGVEKKKMPGWLKVFLIIIVIIIIILGLTTACTAGMVGTIDEAIDETTESYKDKNGKTSFLLNESFENSYTKITMLEVNTDFKDYSQYLGPADGNKVVMAKFEIQNIDEKNDEQYISSLSFNAYADGVSANQFYYAEDNYNDLSATIGKGKKAIGYVFYEVPVETSEITIEYNDNLWLDGTTIEFVVK